jgi:hypothetical protein
LVSSAPRTKFGLAMKPSRELSRIEQINNSPCPVAFWYRIVLCKKGDKRLSDCFSLIGNQKAGRANWRRRHVSGEPSSLALGLAFVCTRQHHKRASLELNVSSLQR